MCHVKWFSCLFLDNCRPRDLLASIRPLFGNYRRKKNDIFDTIQMIVLSRFSFQTAIFPPYPLAGPRGEKFQICFSKFHIKTPMHPPILSRRLGGNKIPTPSKQKKSWVRSSECLTFANPSCGPFFYVCHCVHSAMGSFFACSQMIADLVTF